jgi:hypothetical protein
MNALQKLRQTTDELKSHPLSAERWGLAERLLVRMSRETAQIAAICKARDISGLEALVASLEGKAAAPASQTYVFSEKDQVAALAAFKKRMKLTRLSDESKLGGRQLSGGHTSDIDAILPPTEFPPAIWEALADAGKLKRFGQGFYGVV